MCDDKVRWCSSGVHIYAKTKHVLRKKIDGGPFKCTVSDTISDALVDQATKLDPAKTTGKIRSSKRGLLWIASNYVTCGKRPY